MLHGNILNISSASSIRPAACAYTISKWDIRGYTQGLARTLLPYGITVNALAPGPTATPLLRKPDTNDISLTATPSGRYALPCEIASMAVILDCSPLFFKEQSLRGISYFCLLFLCFGRQIHSCSFGLENHPNMPAYSCGLLYSKVGQ